MFNAKNQQGYYQGQTNNWKGDLLVKQLDRIQQIVSECLTFNGIIATLLPLALITALRLEISIAKNDATREFRGTVVWEYSLVILATISYGVNFHYLLPVLTLFWDCFHQNITVVELGQNLWQFQTVQASVALIIHLSICKLTFNSFKLLESFQERYDNLKNIRHAFEVNTLTEITLRAKFMEQLPEILNRAITTQMQAVISSLIVNGSLNSTQTEQLQQSLSRSVSLIANDVLGQISHPPLSRPEQQQFDRPHEAEYDD